jgi:hypothetical protein
MGVDTGLISGTLVVRRSIIFLFVVIRPR